MARRNETQTVVLLPSFGASLADYPQLHRGLEERGVRVHAVPYDWGDVTATLEDLNAITRDHIDALGVSDQAVLLGHSMGATLAGYEASRRPYGRLALCSSNPLGSLAGWERTPFSEVRAAWEEYQAYKVIRQLAALATKAVFGRVQVVQKERSVLFGQYEVLEEVARHASDVARTLGVTAQVVPQAGHFIDHYPSYVDAVVRAVTA